MRKILLPTLCFIAIFLPFLIAIFLVLRLLFEGNISDWRYAAVVLLLFVAACLCGYKNRPLPPIWDQLLLGGTLLLLLPVLAIGLLFGRLDMIVFFAHWTQGVEGIPIVEFLPTIFTAVTYSCVIFWCYRFLYRYLHRIKVVGLLIAIPLLYSNSLPSEIAYLVGGYGAHDTSLAERLEAPQIALTQQKPDLVIIYLEGTERTFGEPVFNDIYDPVRIYEDQGLVFTNVDQVDGTGSSVSGMIASQCGVPLLPRGIRARKGLEDVDDYLSGIDCLSDHLGRAGYASRFIVGASLSFVGIDKFYSRHGIDELIGLKSLETRLPADIAEANRIKWGFSDEVVFDQALLQFQELAADTAPFVLIVETIGPHGSGNGGYLAPSCVEPGAPLSSARIEPTVRCTAGLTQEFIETIRSETPGRDLRIVLLSDHLSHQNNATERLDRFERRNTAIFLSDDTEPRHIGKYGSMLDIYPTMLDWMGVLPDGSGAGLGRSLLAQAPTLSEEIGIRELGRLFSGDADLASVIWGVDTGE
ncbi:sulfatase-like hydrolase/transferase [Halocynthiibacter styelae]|uniref:Sulfatase-like hydrolase/transferase n=1 Tax=Halocynthiibacter styelae TaxID=2761955 RepID=A0A8J7LQ13_9RHOB|nr:sulfatase-like hydrolase/transferase [Paenihalocynthiibacter styelae]MBI1493637.1 sulfatase-like hydrolase/transferase [Paenihalocynthiibacter styelae]